ncbi:MAG TPA: sigma-70 family RNA polymerase sigma factor [Candidatus Angelobacter sp.]|nr:sigma-70 family RNA polymerase sigma factor [Candidatus Angelobacter sp.]
MTAAPGRAGGRPADPDLAAVRAAQVDRAAFGVLYRRYLDRVYGYCFYLLGDHHDAEDATERTFLAALGAIDRFRDTGSTFRAWLFRIAHNQLANALRSRKRRGTTPLDTVAEPSGGIDPARALDRADDARRVRQALAALAPDRRQVLVLRFVDGLSAREIGDVLGRSEGAIRVLQHRALRDLARLLG